MDFRLREILNERGITIRSFAEKMGVVANSLPVSVNYSPSLTALQRYARALGVPSADMIHRPDSPATNPCTDDYDDINAHVLSRIRSVMAMKRLSMKLVAARAGISPASLSITLKNNKMSTTTLEKIARGLDVEPWTLLEAEPAAEKTPPEPSAPKAKLGVMMRTMVEAEPEKSVYCHDALDLIDKMKGEEREVVMQEGITYVYGNLRITIVNGEIEIRVKKDSL